MRALGTVPFALWPFLQFKIDPRHAAEPAFAFERPGVTAFAANPYRVGVWNQGAMVGRLSPHRHDGEQPHEEQKTDKDHGEEQSAHDDGIAVLGRRSVPNA
jgi:hypothetical protein